MSQEFVRPGMSFRRSLALSAAAGVLCLLCSGCGDGSEPPVYIENTIDDGSVVNDPDALDLNEGAGDDESNESGGHGHGHAAEHGEVGGAGNRQEEREGRDIGPDRPPEPTDRPLPPQLQNYRPPPPIYRPPPVYRPPPPPPPPRPIYRPVPHGR